MPQLVLVRHGQSEWNLENRFTGWTDVDLSPQGMNEALQAGRTLKTEGLEFDVAFTSVLKRAIRTLWCVLDEMDLMWLPVHRTWKLNERHYGALQGLNKSETAAKFGEAQVKIWRRAYAVRPNPLSPDDPTHPRFDRRYRHVDPSRLPSTESLADTLARVVECWSEEIAPCLQRGQNVLIAAHGNSLRALAKHLLDISDEAIVELNIPTGMPWLFELNDQLQVTANRYLGDPEAVAAAAEAVARQGSVRG